MTTTHPWYIEDDNGYAGLHYMHNGRAVQFESKEAAQKYIDQRLDAGIYAATDVEPVPFEV